MMLSNDISRCSNESCKRKNNCRRYLDCLPFEIYFYSCFDEKDCKFFIEYKPDVPEKERKSKYKR